jgi:hypothetical protein
MPGEGLARYTAVVDFRGRLLATLRAIRGVLDVPGVMVIGSQVPNLLQADAASTLVVSQDVDVGVPVDRLAEVKRQLGRFKELAPSAEEPSVWVPRRKELLEVNFVGLDAATRDASDTYVLEDAELPLLVFGTLSLLRRGPEVQVEGARFALPRPADLLLEKLLTDRSAAKGDRDLLVALALLLVAGERELAELAGRYRALPLEMRYAARSALTVLSLMAPVPGMPDPGPHRALVAGLLRRLEAADAESR